MYRLNHTVVSDKEPCDKETLWLDTTTKTLKWYTKGNWEVLVGFSEELLNALIASNIGVISSDGSILINKPDANTFDLSILDFAEYVVNALNNLDPNPLIDIKNAWRGTPEYLTDKVYSITPDKDYLDFIVDNYNMTDLDNKLLLHGLTLGMHRVKFNNATNVTIMGYAKDSDSPVVSELFHVKPSDIVEIINDGETIQYNIHLTDYIRNIVPVDLSVDIEIVDGIAYIRFLNNANHDVHEVIDFNYSLAQLKALNPATRFCYVPSLNVQRSVVINTEDYPLGTAIRFTGTILNYMLTIIFKSAGSTDLTFMIGPSLSIRDFIVLKTNSASSLNGWEVLWVCTNPRIKLNAQTFSIYTDTQGNQTTDLGKIVKTVKVENDIYNPNDEGLVEIPIIETSKRTYNTYTEGYKHRDDNGLGFVLLVILDLLLGSEIYTTATGSDYKAKFGNDFIFCLDIYTSSITGIGMSDGVKSVDLPTAYAYSLAASSHYRLLLWCINGGTVNCRLFLEGMAYKPAL